MFILDCTIVTLLFTILLCFEKVINPNQKKIDLLIALLQLDYIKKHYYSFDCTIATPNFNAHQYKPKFNSAELSTLAQQDYDEL